jgi:hypothetical protein
MKTYDPKAQINAAIAACEAARDAWIADRDDDALKYARRAMAAMERAIVELATPPFIPPVEDDALNVCWWQHVNPRGIHITKVQCRETGMTVTSKRFRVGGMMPHELAALVAWMRKPVAPSPTQLPPKGISATG